MVFLCFQELRERFEEEAKEENRTCLLLSATVPAIKSHIDNGYNTFNLSRYFFSPTLYKILYLHSLLDKGISSSHYVSLNVAIA